MSDKNQTAITKNKMSPELLIAWRFATWSADANARALKTFQDESKVAVQRSVEETAKANESAAQAQLAARELNP